VTSPLVPEVPIPTTEQLLAPDPNAKTGPMAIQINKNWQSPFIGGLIQRMEKTGDDMVQEAQQIAPIGLTGELSRSIYRKVVQTRGASGRFGDAVLIFGADVDYALAVEFGHHTVDGGFVDAQPFLRPVAMKPRRIG
jgi:hypothetical protein